jgi:hypothetical protein
MTQLQFLMEWGKYAVGVAFWVCFTWPAVVRLFWPWHRDAWGWNMVLKTEMVAVALLASVLKTEFGIRPGLPLEWVAVGAVTLIPFIVIWRTWIIYRDQQRGVAEGREQRERRRRGDG